VSSPPEQPVTATAETASGRPLIVTSEPALLEELLRLCDAAGIAPLVAADPVALRRGWRAASMVLLGAELAVAAGGLPRRSGVVVVGTADVRLWELAVDVSADHVAILPAAAGWLAGMLAESGEPATARAPVLCVVGGQGGAGATTLATALARTAAARGTTTLLIDADLYGGGVDLALGLESAEGDRWAQLTREGAGGGLVGGFIERLPARGGLHLLAPDRDQFNALSAPLMQRVLEEGRQRCGLVVVDLPRVVDPVSATALALARSVYLVVPAQVRAVAAAATLAAALRQETSEVQAIVRGPAPSGLSVQAVARSLGIPVAALLRAEPGLIRDYERGVPPGQPRGPLARLCLQLLDRIDADEGGAAA
jgi:secretion/DNA translocation related CpaE-like protein